jgi:hypothetical protein
VYKTFACKISKLSFYKTDLMLSRIGAVAGVITVKLANKNDLITRKI